MSLSLLPQADAPQRGQVIFGIVGLLPFATTLSENTGKGQADEPTAQGPHPGKEGNEGQCQFKDN